MGARSFRGSGSADGDAVSRTPVRWVAYGRAGALRCARRHPPTDGKRLTGVPPDGSGETMTTRPRRLSPLDASFLAVESDTAPMHVGWAAVFSPSGDDARPTFEQLRDHIAARMGRAPRYRQRLARVPLGLQPPVWVDDEHFAVERHVRHDTSRDLAALAGAVMSEPLPADRP